MFGVIHNSLVIRMLKTVRACIQNIKLNDLFVLSYFCNTFVWLFGSFSILIKIGSIQINI